jgi:hypothetical protein
VRLGLPERPQPDDRVLAVLAAAVAEAWPKPQPVREEPDARALAWRFSGRWWYGPPVLRRRRPGDPRQR